jgi:hypothetical protein
LRVKEHFQNFVIVSVAFVVASSLTLGFVFPLQSLLISASTLEIGLLFLPHGVRVLAFHFFGWRAVLYLLPTSYLFWLLSNQAGSQLDPMSPVVSMIACYLGYKAATLLPVFKDRVLAPSLWKFLVIAGATSSLANGVALSVLQHQGAEIVSVIGYLVGDISGLIVCFLILMYAFRFARLLAMANDA